MEIKVHKNENALFAAKVACTVVVLAGLALLVAALAKAPEATGLSSLIVFGIYGLMIWIFVMVQKIFLVAYLKGNGVAITERQFPEVYAAYKAMAAELGLANPPRLFLIQEGGALNAFALRFSGKNYIAIYSEVLALLDSDMDAVRFVLAHELGHVRRAHMSKRFWTFPSSLVPLLTPAYSRACEYTCDNIGRDLSPAEPRNGLALLAAGPQLYRKLDVRAYIADAADNDSAAVKFGGLFMSHPYLPKRLANLEDR